ncbi:Tub family protein [Ancylostoma ceylanicum]|uniref:Tub family protein n=1 Tax=Ancylostoma ceylanicum TaxID=53326 RepID=A0A0D6LW19_9BILA|nr:Tub family protein [Ancylostoma ceylanicum]
MRGAIKKRIDRKDDMGLNQMAKQLNISRKFVQMTVKNELGLRTSDTWKNAEDKNDVEEHTLPSEELPAYDEIAANIEKFVQAPAKRNVIYKCSITRDKRGVDKGIYPTYYLHLEREDKKKIFLLAARRRKKSTTANYLISTDATDLKREGTAFVGKVSRLHRDAVRSNLRRVLLNGFSLSPERTASVRNRDDKFPRKTRVRVAGAAAIVLLHPISVPELLFKLARFPVLLGVKRKKYTALTSNTTAFWQ